MNNVARSAIFIVLLVVGVGSGIGLTTVLGGSKEADRCFGAGAGAFQREIAVPAAAGALSGGKTYTVCSKLGQQVIFDAETGEVVDVSLYEDQLLEYYKQHPEENPRLIAEKTADAEFAANSFTTPEIPTPATDDCPPGTLRTDFPAAAVSICVPTYWNVTSDSPRGVLLKGDSSVIGVYGPDRRGSEGTKCANPASVDLRTGTARVCALNKGPQGGQGHGIVLANGREMGVSFVGAVPDATRSFVFQVAFSVEVK